MTPRGRTTDRLAVFGAAAVLFALVVAWRAMRSDPPSPEPDPAPAPAAFPLPPFTESAYLNTGPDAKYIGAAACAECHRPEHLSYLHTEHSRALADIDVNEEPPDGSFFHKLSGRSYRVYREGKTLRHEEVLRTEDGREIARVDAPIRYRIGSGNFTRSYIVEIEGFLQESPITWYAQKKRWGVSPGYDQEVNSSFERGISLECVACHAGRVEPLEGSLSRMNILEKSIGCESCHGPGSLHRERCLSKPPPSGEDRTIVHPGKLPRNLLESICANCHQAEAAAVLLRGRDHSDFRPGRPLVDYRIDYRVDSGDEKMTVVGHMEQLRRSACYQKSEGMSCLTCHDPHQKEKPGDPVAFHRQQCLTCHDVKSCRTDPRQRVAKADNCMACHMPRGDTDIPHIAFTHHRIGKHPLPPSAKAKHFPELVPIDDISKVPELDRRRNLGLAYAFASQQSRFTEHADAFRKRALDLLEPLHREGLRGDETSAALASLLRSAEPARALSLGREAAFSLDVPPAPRATAMAMIGIHEMKSGNLGAAEPVLADLASIRRNSNDSLMLAELHLMRNEPEKAVVALRRALTVRPFRASIHFGLAEAYTRLGDAARAQEHLEKAKWLSERKLN